MSQNSYDINAQVIRNEHCLKVLELKGKPQFSKYEMENLEDKVHDLKIDRGYIYFAGVSTGAILAVLACHFLH